jgi:hypothetical protein
MEYDLVTLLPCHDYFIIKQGLSLFHTNSKDFLAAGTEAQEPNYSMSIYRKINLKVK